MFALHIWRLTKNKTQRHNGLQMWTGFCWWWWWRRGAAWTLQPDDLWPPCKRCQMVWPTVVFFGGGGEPQRFVTFGPRRCEHPYICITWTNLFTSPPPHRVDCTQVCLSLCCSPHVWLNNKSGWSTVEAGHFFRLDPALSLWCALIRAHSLVASVHHHRFPHPDPYITFACVLCWFPWLK